MTALPANHVVPAIGFHLDSGKASLVFTGDTTTNDALWPHVNQIRNLRYLVIETARVPMQSGFGVVGRIDGGAFAVTAGTIEPWGLTNMSPAMLVGSPTESLLDLPKTLRAMPLE